MKKRLLLSVLLMLLVTLATAVHARADGLTPALTVNGSATSTSVEFNEAPVIRVCAPGATAVRLLGVRLYPEDDPPKEWDHYYDRYEVAPIIEENGMKMFDRGTWKITAEYTTEDYDDDIDLHEADIDWTPIGSGVTVQVADWIARLQAPEAALSATSVSRGESITVTIEESSFRNMNEWYWIDLERFVDDDWEWMEHINTDIAQDGNHTFNFSTIGLDPGNYRLWLRTEAVGYEDNGTYLPFTVTDATVPALSFALSQSKTQVGRDIMLWAYAPGADSVSVDFSREGDPYWNDRRECGGEYGRWTYNFSDADIYTFIPKARVGGELIEGSPVTLTLTAPGGSLDDPTVNGVPSVMPMGTDIVGSFNPVDNAEQYHITLYYCPEGSEWQQLVRAFRWPDEAGYTDLTLPGELFERPGCYRLRIHARKPGWGTGNLEHSIIVTEPMDEALSLTFNGSADDVTGWLSHRSFHVDVEYPDSVTALYILNDDHWEFFDAEDFDGVYWGFESGDYTLVALAAEDEPFWRADGYDWSQFDSDELDWSMISNVVQVNVVAPEGRLVDPVLTVPETVQRGEWLRVNISEVPNAEDFYLHVFHRDENGWEYGWEYNAEYSSAGEVLIPTATFEEGETLYVRVDAHAVGYDSGNSADMPFTVTEGASTESFLVSDTDVLTREEVSWSVYAPGAEHVRVVCDAELYSEEFGDSLSDRRDFEHPGNYELKAIAPDGDGWRVIGEPIVVHVSAPYGDLPAEIDAPASVSSTGTAEFTVTWNHGDVRALYETTLNTMNWMACPLELVGFNDENGVATGTYRIRGEHLTPGDTYIIETWLRPEEPGYSPTRVFAEIVVTSGTARGTVTVSKTELLRCESAKVTVDVPGATALYVYHGEGHWDGFAGSHAEEDWEFYGSGDNRVYARYTTQTISDPDNVDFESLNWEGTTPVATVHVNVIGKLNLPVYSLESEIVRRGQPFRFTISEDQNLDEWYVGMLRTMDGEEVSFGFWDSLSRTLKVETVDVEPDLYYLDLHGDAIGYEGCDVRLFVAVEEPEEGMTVSLPETSVLTMTRHLVTAYAPGAQRIVLTISGDEYDPHEYEQEGERFRDEVTFGHTRGTRHAVFTAYYSGGRTETVEKDIEVIAPDGDLLNPTLHMEEPWIEGRDLQFTVDSGEAMFIMVSIRDRRTAEYVYFDEYSNFDDWHYVIPADRFEPGHIYDIEVFSVREGYNANSTLFWMAPLPEDPDTLTLPAALTEIETEAFEGVAAEKIVIPGTVTSVAANAFANCPNILVVEIEDGATGISADAFSGSGAFMVYGHAGSDAEAYANANTWATFICLD